MRYDASTAQTGSRTLSAEAHKVLRNTYMLLGMTLAFSALAAFFALATGLRLNIFVFFIGAYGLMFLTHKLADSAWGLLSVFGFTGFMGLSLGPILSAYLGAGMGNVVVSALSMTALVFFGLSAVALVTKKDFSFLGKFLLVGGLVLIAGIVANLFLGMAGLHLALSAGFVIFASALILFQTSEIVHGGETNYIRATVGLFVAIYNLFVSLLALLGMSND
ncbi:Bax inhibitor-1/YccA family protein [Marinospirillum alkaliphilum]|uniref:Modulator of FtsH protease n=1 Tax=Marinospirillum alkaliphilum DSM 21637 TaxID=1122209 RepID=A0A1K1TWK4_9GAMM|nr:Bax inhibitor-1/YccA family protein [Marinospirillum alkaliphilum]SFX04451.1 modulator of FtsH protease [Marinospirillum alkaliphilum DSM 21637]